MSGNDFLALEGGLAENNAPPNASGEITVTLQANGSGKTRSGVLRVQSRSARNSFVDVKLTQLGQFSSDATESQWPRY